MLTMTDHMFLIPERALKMDISRLQEDLAGLDFDARLLQVAPMGNVWICPVHLRILDLECAVAVREDIMNLKRAQEGRKQKRLPVM